MNKFDNKHLHDGFMEIQKFLHRPIRGNYEIKASQTLHDGFRIVKSSNSIDVSYSSISSFYTSLLYISSHDELNYEKIVCGGCKNFGYMIDCSRNAVPKIASLKRLITNLALSGYTFLQLYTEDTYQIEGEPYFGYLRGGYTSKELQEVVAYAKIFGIEVVPCIQTLAHLNAIFKWDSYDEVKDIDDILLAECEKTYQLIDKMVSTCRKNFETTQLMVGMDEAHHLGRGAYYSEHGHADKAKIMLNHLERVCAICQKYDFNPIMWGDMFFKIAFGKQFVYEGGEIPESVKKIVPQNLKLIYWDYFCTSESGYDNMFRLNMQLVRPENLAFTGALWKCYGYAPQISLSEVALSVALKSARKFGINEVMLSAWADNGAECSMMAVASLAVYAGYYNTYGEENFEEIDKMSMSLLGYTHSEFRILEKCNLPLSAKDNSNKSKYFFYSDLLLGLYEDRVEADFAQRYNDIASQLEILANRKSHYNYIFKNLSNFCKVLSRKCYAIFNLRSAYLGGDKIALTKLALEILPDLKEKVILFFDTKRLEWQRENKIFGLDVLDIRIGGMKERIDFAIFRLKEYLDGNIECIEELEVERLKYFTKGDNEYLLNQWKEMVSVNPI